MKGMINMKLIVGLGNPGKEYDKTRHNIGYMFLDYLTNDVKFVVNKKMNAMEYTCKINDEKIIYIKPLSFMNNSGIVVKSYVDFYHLDLSDILIIQDDLDMSVGKYKLLFNHGDGGHNGIKNIILCMKSREFLRLKIGISKANIDTKDYVLGKFNKNDLEILDATFDKLKNFIVDYITLNKDLLMGKYNTKEK